MPSAADIEAIERATLQAVAPELVESLPGWLLPMDHGTVGRARSAVPLQHSPPDIPLLEPMLARYTARGFTPRFRLPDCPGSTLSNVPCNRTASRASNPPRPRSPRCEAAQRSITQAFQQADAGNAAALALYARLGFSTAWAYAYWHRQSEAD